jgi:hypothetical protein
MAEYLIQRVGSVVSGVQTPRWLAGLATPTMPIWTEDRTKGRRFLTEVAANEVLSRIANPQDQYQIVPDA